MRLDKLACLAAVATLSLVPNTLRSEPTANEVDAYVVADQDADGHLSDEEFREFVELLAEAGNSRAKRIRFFGAYGFAFGMVDANDDGVLSPDELMKANAEH